MERERISRSLPFVRLSGPGTCQSFALTGSVKAKVGKYIFPPFSLTSGARWALGGPEPPPSPFA